jgi:hypothetical protein
MRVFIAFFIAAVALTVAANATPSLAGRPDPSFNVSCTVGGETVLSWKGVHLAQVDIEWRNSSDVSVGSMSDTSPPRKQLSVPTPPNMDVGGIADVRVVFTRPINGAGGAHLLPATCS